MKIKIYLSVTSVRTRYATFSRKVKFHKTSSNRISQNKIPQKCQCIRYTVPYYMLGRGGRGEHQHWFVVAFVATPGVKKKRGRFRGDTGGLGGGGVVL